MEATKTNYHPILFSTPMVQALLEGRKTQTRRTKVLDVVNDNLETILDLKLISDPYKTWALIRTNSKGSYKLKCPYHIGDVLWVRENFHYIHDSDTNEFLRYGYQADKDYKGAKWKPSIHMPKVACRIFLKIKSIRVERLQDISEEDAKAEGAKDRLRHSDLKVLENLKDWMIPSPFQEHQFGFLAIWCTINGCESWLANPFVWVYEFEQIEKPSDFL